MSAEKHDLRKDFPDYIEQIHHLKTHDAHFTKLAEEYHGVNHEVNLIEEGVKATSDDVLDSLKLKRLTLKDKLYQMLKQAQAVPSIE